jgi:hypothetical protein
MMLIQLQIGQWKTHPPEFDVDYDLDMDEARQVQMGMQIHY